MRTSSPARIAWATTQASKICACGCDQTIRPLPRHRYTGVPRYLPWHGNRDPDRRKRSRVISQWLRENAGKHICACGCGEAIPLRREHFRHGPPQHIQRHYARMKKGTRRTDVAGRPLVNKRYLAYFPSTTKQIVGDAFAWRCAWCRETELLEFDHWIPVAEGGTADIENCLPLCPTCHRWKTLVARSHHELRREAHLRASGIETCPDLAAHQAELERAWKEDSCPY